MPATALDPRTALVIIDLQKGLASRPSVHPMPGIIDSAARLAAAFRRAQLPVVLVSVGFSEDGGDRLQPRADQRMNLPFTPDFADIVPELGPEPSDLRIVKRQPNAFYGTELDLQLRRRGVTGIVLAGFTSSNGVDSTARGAFERAYNVTFASDAITDFDPAAHDFVFQKIFPRLGETDTTEAILALLAKR
jgi:nicotinamidase-related amidase